MNPPPLLPRHPSTSTRRRRRRRNKMRRRLASTLHRWSNTTMFSNRLRITRPSDCLVILLWQWNAWNQGHQPTRLLLSLPLPLLPMVMASRGKRVVAPLLGVAKVAVAALLIQSQSRFGEEGNCTLSRPNYTIILPTRNIIVIIEPSEYYTHGTARMARRWHGTAVVVVVICRNL